MFSTIGPYLITETLKTEGWISLFRGIHQKNRRPFIIKLLRENSPPEMVARLQHEYEIEQELKSAYVVKPYELGLYDGQQALVMEDCSGKSLENFVESPMDIGMFLDLAIKLSAAVADLHRRGVIHHDIKPQNIIVTPVHGIKIIDFGIASREGREFAGIRNYRLVEGALAYMSPEQTGRTSQAVDFRSDLYSLGVTFYQMLTGSLPFEANDPVEWIHCHIARVPPSPYERRVSIPVTLSNIVMKLLSKAPQDRYQTASGLKEDLEACLHFWKEGQRIPVFDLGKKDQKFSWPEKLYGREKEIEQLQKKFFELIEKGKVAPVLVSGAAGIGKSALIQELKTRIAEKSGFFASGKFDQFKHDRPYAPMIQALRDLVQDIKSSGEKKIDGWKKRLAKRWGVSGQIIVQLMPELELTIGRPPPLPEVSPAETEARFRSVFSEFLGTFAEPEHPLILFLDDLQWADPASLQLIEYLLIPIPHLLLIGAYRDDDPHSSQLLFQMLERIKTKKKMITSIHLNSLSREALTDFIADTFHVSRKRAGSLALVTEQKTLGNPFFTIQFLSLLCEEELIRQDQGGWVWEAEQLKKVGFAENVIDLMVKKLSRLPPKTLEIVKKVACLGGSVSLETLSFIESQLAGEVRKRLAPALKEGLLLSTEDSYQFFHDRVQQAAYSLIPEEKRGETHLQMGRLLYAVLKPEENESLVFEVINQYHAALSLLTDPDEKHHLANLFCIAGRKAKESTAWATALGYLETGISLLGKEAWSRDHQLAFDLIFGCAECSYLTGDFEKAESLFPELLEESGSKIAKAKVYRLKIEMGMTRGEPSRCFEAGIEAIRVFGIQVSPRPSEIEIRNEYETLWHRLGDWQIENLIDLPAMTDPEMIAITEILFALIPPAYFGNMNLFSWIHFRAANLFLQYGQSPAAAPIYASLGVILGPVFGRYEEGYRFARLGCHMAEKRGIPDLQGKVCFIFGAMVSFWTQPYSTGADYLLTGIEISSLAGDLNYACYSSVNRVLFRFNRGEPLNEVNEELEKRFDFVQNAKFEDYNQALVSLHRQIDLLMGRTTQFSDLNDDELKDYEAHLKTHFPLMLWVHYVHKMEAELIFGDFPQAYQTSRKMQTALIPTQANILLPEAYYYMGLILASSFSSLSPDEQQKVLETLMECHRKFEQWSKICPENFLCKKVHLSAEIARLQKKEIEAIRLYEEAAAVARSYGLIQIEAIVCEMAARFHHESGLSTTAEAYLRRSRGCYLLWGAVGKVRQLDRLFPHLVPQKGPVPSPTFVTEAGAIDLLSVAKAQQAISSEIVLSRLWEKLLQIILEQAGAERGYFVFVQNNGFLLQAAAEVEGASIRTRTFRSVPVSSASLPISILQHAVQTQGSVLLTGSPDDGIFSADPYIRKVRPKSVLCLPIIRRMAVTALVYLENNLVSGAFTPEKNAILNLLIPQAAISLENASLYSSLREENEERKSIEGILKEKNEALEGLSRIKDEFITMVTHELRTPLAVVTEGLDLTLEKISDLLNQEQAEILTRVKKNIKRLGRMINNVLDFQKLGSSLGPLHFRLKDLAEIVREAHSILLPEIEKGEIHFEIDLPDPLIVWCDPERILQVFLNLIENAIRFTPAGGEVRIESRKLPEGYEVIVEDTGIGIKPQDRGKIFQIFSQAYHQGIWKTGGFGVGLAICKKIMDLHAGQIRTEDRPGGGSRFIATLPFPPEQKR
ncbi:MAG: AAA family ATPase [Deltaproteobacteria bacterium]|nr:AAA family ATPase [Deltaproteobacteria bacterium]